MNLKESFDKWVEDCGYGPNDVLTQDEVNEFFKCHEAQQKQPIVKPIKITIDEAYRDYKISVRTFNVLNRHKIMTINDLANYERKDLEKLRNMGAKSIFELEKIMDEHGIAFEKPTKFI